ncbi:MAG TPA: hypothetical protein VGJ71_03740 [Candidatus Limnocylindrales bacterium]
MPTIVSIAEVLFTFVFLSLPFILLVALLRGDGPASLVNLWKAPDFNAWPRGVQEEEPFRWGTTA